VRDVRVEADGELADVARALVGVEDLVELLRVALAGGLDDLAVLEDEADVLEFWQPTRGIGRAKNLMQTLGKKVSSALQ
jgi:hypothetical protein